MVVLLSGFQVFLNKDIPIKAEYTWEGDVGKPLTKPKFFMITKLNKVGTERNFHILIRTAKNPRTNTHSESSKTESFLIT